MKKVTKNPIIMKELDNLNHNYGKVIAISSLLALNKNNPESFVRELNQFLDSFLNQYLKTHDHTIFKKLPYLEDGNYNLSRFFRDNLDTAKRNMFSDYFEDLSIDLRRYRVHLNKL